MTPRAAAVERAFAAQDALLTALRAREEFTASGVGLGPPVGTRPEAAWVSCSFEGDMSPEASDLSQFESSVELAAAIALTEHFGLKADGTPDEDWTALRGRLAVRVSAVEHVLEADPFLGGTCSLAWVSKVTVREGLVDAKQVRLSAAVIVQAKQYLR